MQNLHPIWERPERSLKREAMSEDQLPALRTVPNAELSIAVRMESTLPFPAPADALDLSPEPKLWRAA
jgi:hypothetical protein